MLICLVCYRDLPPLAELLGVHPSKPIVCECGTAYTRSLLFNADPKIWAAVLRRDGWEVNTAGVHGPVVTRTEGSI